MAGCATHAATQCCHHHLCFPCRARLLTRRAHPCTIPTDGPYWGGNAIFGALGATIVALVVGGLICFGAMSALPLPPHASSEGVGLLLMTLTLGFTALFLK